LISIVGFSFSLFFFLFILRLKDGALDNNREARRQEWELFMADLTDKCRAVDESFAEREHELRRHYASLNARIGAETSSPT
jgi:hypothetical protein